jgi:hypothetical protein
MDELNEKPLDPQQRRKRAIQMKRLAPKIAIKRKIALRKKASGDNLIKRAEKQAKNLIRKKMTKGKDYKSLPYQARINIDKMVERKKGLIAKIAKKLLPKIKKQEIERMKSKGDSKNESI